MAKTKKKKIAKVKPFKTGLKTYDGSVADKAMDRKRGIKEGSKKDNVADSRGAMAMLKRGMGGKKK